MSANDFHPSRFSPAIMQAEDLEAIFVQRDALASRLVSQISSSVLGSGKQHNLLVGARGMGKTHLISILHHRLRALGELREKAVFCWLPEDEWGVGSFLELLLRILKRASSDRPLVEESALEPLYAMPPDTATLAATRMLLDALGGRTLVLLIENLNEVFQCLGSDGQAALRSFYQEHACCTTLATTTTIFEGISIHDSPFYGFFRIQHLEKLGQDDSVELLAKLARRRGDLDLAAFAKEPLGRARIRAIHHLAAGNPRSILTLAGFIRDRQDLDDLLHAYLRMLDDLTPYYQAQMQALSTQQRQIVEFLCEHWKPATVKEVARRCFIGQQTCSGQLRKLASSGMVLSEIKGRETWCEIAEPLLRHCVALKKNRGRPVRQCVEFLKIWHTPDRLVSLLLEDSLKSEIQQQVRQAFMDSIASDPVGKSRNKELDQALQAQDWKRAAMLLEELHVADPRRSHPVYTASMWANAGEEDKAIQGFEAALRSGEEMPPGWQDMARVMLGMILALRGEHGKAIPHLEQVTEQSRFFDDVQETAAWSYICLREWKHAQTRFSWLMLRQPTASARLRFGHAMAADYAGDAQPLVDWINECATPDAAEALGLAQSEVIGRLSGIEAPMPVLELFQSLNTRINRWMNEKGLLRENTLGFLRGTVARSKSLNPHTKDWVLKLAKSWPHEPDGILKAAAVLWLESGRSDLYQWPQEERAVLEEVISERESRSIAPR